MKAKARLLQCLRKKWAGDIKARHYLLYNDSRPQMPAPASFSKHGTTIASYLSIVDDVAIFSDESFAIVSEMDNLGHLGQNFVRFPDRQLQNILDLFYPFPQQQHHMPRHTKDVRRGQLWTTVNQVACYWIS